MDAPKIVASRQKGKNNKGEWLADMAGYIFPVAILIPFALAALYVLPLGRSDFIDRLHELDAMGLGIGGVPCQREALYSLFANSLLSNYASLAVTLRDKHLISKEVERGVIGFLAIPAVCLTAGLVYDFVFA